MTNHPRRQRPPTEVLYARLPADLIEWLRAQAEQSGLSMAQAAGAILAYCRDAGLTLGTPAPAPRLHVASGLARAELAPRRASSPLARDTSA